MVTEGEEVRVEAGAETPKKKNVFLSDGKKTGFLQGDVNRKTVGNAVGLVQMGRTECF
jgi:hypothetical protein